jgi:hypothetical protein
MDDEQESPVPAIIGRRDGWTPFARRTFLSTPASTGRVTFSAQCAGMTKQSAYALRNRDPVFGAGWDAACHLARDTMADEFREQAISGTIETVTRNGEVVAERHRYDSRLQIAVLNRMDKHCEAAVARRADFLGLVRNWDQWLELVGAGDDEAARSVLATGSLPGPQDCQVGQLLLGADGARQIVEDPIGDAWEDDGIWWTDFAPPPDFDGVEEGRWGDYQYKRHCTDDEAELMQRLTEAEQSDGLSDARAARDEWFAARAAELSALEEDRGGA